MGVVLRDDGAVLMADRPAGKPYAGYWEFPGGKIESGEPVDRALARELAEELGIAVRESVPWLVFEFDYPHAYVRLHFRRVFDWTGTPASLEGQRLAFHRIEGDAPQPLLPAARPVMRWLRLPARLELAVPARRTDAGERRPAEHWIAGSRWSARTVTDAVDLARAAADGADFALALDLPGGALAELCRQAPIPVYAPDPGTPDALQRLRRLGVHGLFVDEAAPS